MTQSRDDSPGVIVFPPLIPLTALILGLCLDWLVPIALLGRVPTPLRVAVAAVLIVGGGFMVARAIAAFHKAETNVNPRQPTLALVTTGIFAKVRNPMYAGGNLILLGIAIALGSVWVLILLIPAVFVLHYGVVLREECYLEAKFGNEYCRYKDATARYGWPL